MGWGPIMGKGALPWKLFVSVLHILQEKSLIYGIKFQNHRISYYHGRAPWPIIGTRPITGSVTIFCIFFALIYATLKDIFLEIKTMIPNC
jgi:hypothetical protein